MNPTFEIDNKSIFSIRTSVADADLDVSKMLICKSYFFPKMFCLYFMRGQVYLKKRQANSETIF